MERPPQLYDMARFAKSPVAGALNLVGFEFDGTACFRKGAALGPNAIRKASPGIESYSPYLGEDTAALPPFYDVGNLPLGGSGRKLLEKLSGSAAASLLWRTGSELLVRALARLDLRTTPVLTLGGEHSISYAPIKAYLGQFRNLALIHLDAHADLRDGYQGLKYSHASIIRRALDDFGPQHRLIQYGIRSGTKDEYRWMRESKTLCQSREDFLHSVQNIAADRPIYLTLDLDYFDPSHLPGTGTPEAGGEDFPSFVKLAKILQGKRLVGADVVELAPNLDSSGNSSVFAAKVVRELIILLNRPRGVNHAP